MFAPMDPSARFTHQVDQYAAWQRETIRSYGWVVEAVLGDDESPPFAYTVGLSGFGHPELILFATSQATAGSVLNQLGEHVRAGEDLWPGASVRVSNGTVALIEFPGSEEWLLAANSLYRRPGDPPVPALLVVPADDLEPSPGSDRSCEFCS